MDTLGGFKVGDRVKCQTEKPSDCGEWWNHKKPGFVGTVERIQKAHANRYEPEFDCLLVGGNYYRPHWLTKIEDAAPKAEQKPYNGYTSFMDEILKSPFHSPLSYGFGPGLYTSTPKVTEHDELLTLRAERDSERRWAAHWKGVADKREDEFKRATTAEVECAALVDVVEAQDEELKALKVENRALKICRDDWISEAARAKHDRSEMNEERLLANEARDSALTFRNISLAVASAVVGSSGYVLYSCWGLL